MRLDDERRHLRYRLMVFPVTIDAGLRIFPDAHKKTPWTMTDTRTFPSAVRVDTYRRS